MRIEKPRSIGALGVDAMIQYSALTDTGKRRPHNEDTLYVDPTSGVFVVADGVGGRSAGEIASMLTSETFRSSASELAEVVARYTANPEWSTRNQVLETLDMVCQKASQRVYDEAGVRNKQGMTTTLVAMVMGGGAVFLAHIGDSRAYLVRDGLIRQLTEDHSMINELVRSGQMTYDEAMRSPYRGVITRAVGLYPTVQADLMSIEVLPGDRIVLNTDGLSDVVSHEAIESLSSQYAVEETAEKLVQASLDAGAPDNVTVVVVEPESTPQTEAARARARVMEQVFLFKGFPFHTRLRVSRICEQLTFQPGEVLVSEGDPGDAMYVIVQGSVSVSVDNVELATLTAGEHFGELGLLDNPQERSATVTGKEAGSAISIRRTHLQDFCQRDPELGIQLLWKLISTLGDRLRGANIRASRAPFGTDS